VALLPPVNFEGTVLHQKTGVSYPYAGTCVVAIDTQGRESMHVRGAIQRGNREAPVVVLGHTDRSNSFVGREREAASDCFARQCERQPDFAATDFADFAATQH